MFIQGSFVGTLTGLVATLWLGIGAQVYKPAAYKPPVNISGCPLIQMNESMFTMTTEEFTLPTSTEPQPSPISEM